MTVITSGAIPSLLAPCGSTETTFYSKIVENALKQIPDNNTCNTGVFLSSGKHVGEITRLYTPLLPHFYIVKLGYAGVYLFFLFLLQNIDCGYSLIPPRRGGSNVYPQSMVLAKIRIFFLKFSFFTNEKKICKLHGQVFVILKCKVECTRSAG